MGRRAAVGVVVLGGIAGGPVAVAHGQSGATRTAEAPAVLLRSLSELPPAPSSAPLPVAAATNNFRTISPPARGRATRLTLTARFVSRTRITGTVTITGLRVQQDVRIGVYAQACGLAVIADRACQTVGDRPARRRWVARRGRTNALTWRFSVRHLAAYARPLGAPVVRPAQALLLETRIETTTDADKELFATATLASPLFGVRLPPRITLRSRRDLPPLTDE